MNTERKPLTIRVSDDERALIKIASRSGGETVSSWIRRILIAAAKKVKP